MTRFVTVVGVGALGSHLVQLLRSEDATLKVVDFDRVDAKNTGAQFHPKGSVGQLKTTSLHKAMNFLWGVRLEEFPHRLRQENVHAVLGTNFNDLVVDCLDNGASRHIVQEHVSRHGIPCVHGALAADGTYAQVRWEPGFVVDDEPTAGAATCEGGEHLPFIAVTSAYLALAVQTWLRTGKKVGYSISPGGVTVI